MGSHRKWVGNPWQVGLVVASIALSVAGCGSAAATTRPSPSGAAYAVRQTMTMGDETISGTVCSVARDFTVDTRTSGAEFRVYFSRWDASSGAWSFSYNDFAKNEAHEAGGSYKIAAPSAGGILTVTMTGSQQIVTPNGPRTETMNYAFQLVPSPGACPAS